MGLWRSLSLGMMDGLGEHRSDGRGEIGDPDWLKDGVLFHRRLSGSAEYKRQAPGVQIHSQSHCIP